jgi:hypothetical protein
MSDIQDLMKYVKEALIKAGKGDENTAVFCSTSKNMKEK